MIKWVASKVIRGRCMVYKRENIYFIFMYNSKVNNNVFGRIETIFKKNGVYSANVVIEDYYESFNEKKVYGSVKLKDGVIVEAESDASLIVSGYYSGIVEELSYKHHQDKSRLRNRVRVIVENLIYKLAF